MTTSAMVLNPITVKQVSNCSVVRNGNTFDIYSGWKCIASYESLDDAFDAAERMGFSKRYHKSLREYKSWLWLKESLGL